MSARDAALAARDASRALQAAPTSVRVAALTHLADSLLARSADVLAANAADVAAADAAGVEGALRQRLALTEGKLATLAAGIRAIAATDEPLGRVTSRTRVADGLILEKTAAAIGVLLVIFESRPDALPQIAALAIRSGNGLLLKGGKEAARSNAILHELVCDAVAAAAPGVGRGLVALVTTRAGVDELLALDDVIDLCIPRGGNALVTHVQARTKIPVLGHADGVCHMYVDAAADPAMAAALAVDAKTDYPAACNAVETVLIHERFAGRDALLKALTDAGVTLHGGPAAVAALGLPPAPALSHEYGTLDVTVEIVPSMDAAIDWIHAHGSGHTECIVTADAAASAAFLDRVDAACVFVNASTRFADGFRFGLGAEVGISTARIHARGPVGVEGLLTTKWRLVGQGQVVAKDGGVEYRHERMEV